MRAPTPCLDAQCNETATYEGRCEKHQRPPWQGSWRKQTLPKDWNTRRLIVLRRDQGTCYLCGGEGADTVDHVIPGDNHSLENLKAVHDRTPPHCHRYKTTKEAHDAQRGMRTKRRL